MMNSVNLVGKIVDVSKLYISSDGSPYCRFLLSVKRQYKIGEFNQKFDNLPCIAWKNKAVFLSKNLKKGDTLAVTGREQSHPYIDEFGKKRYEIETYVEGFNFLGEKKTENNNSMYCREIQKHVLDEG